MTIGYVVLVCMYLADISLVVQMIKVFGFLISRKDGAFVLFQIRTVISFLAYRSLKIPPH